MASRPYLALCDAGHDDVCYSQDTECPACRIRENLELEIEEMREEIAKLEDTITDLESEPVEDGDAHAA